MYTDQALPPNWEAKWSAQYNRFYYVNHQTKKTQWEKPKPEVPEKPELDYPWEAKWSAQHNRYYFVNHETKQTQWQKPEIAASSGVNADNETSVVETSVEHDDLFGQSNTAAEDKAAEEARLAKEAEEKVAKAVEQLEKFNQIFDSYEGEKFGVTCEEVGLKVASSTYSRLKSDLSPMDDYDFKSAQDYFKRFLDEENEKFEKAEQKRQEEEAERAKQLEREVAAELAKQQEEQEKADKQMRDLQNLVEDAARDLPSHTFESISMLAIKREPKILQKVSDLKFGTPLNYNDLDMVKRTIQKEIDACKKQEKDKQAENEAKVKKQTKQEKAKKVEEKPKEEPIKKAAKKPVEQGKRVPVSKPVAKAADDGDYLKKVRQHGNVARIQPKGPAGHRCDRVVARGPAIAAVGPMKYTS